MKTATITHRNFQLVFNSDVYNGEKLDTTVNILPSYSNPHICVIAGCDIQKFTKEFTELINKYKI